MTQEHPSHLPKAQWIETLEKRISSAAVVLELPDGRAVVVKAWYKKYWSLPGGVIDAGESPRQAALREVAEEVGLQLDESQLAFQRTLYRSSAQLQSYQFTFLAHVTEEQVANLVLQASEIDAYELVTKQHVRDNLDIYGSIVQEWATDGPVYVERIFSSSDE